MLYALAVLVVSIAPALAFLVVILALDRREPEPAALILRTIGLGAASAVPAAIVEAVLDGVPLFSLPGFAGAVATAFIQVAPVEEACKLAVVLLYAWRKPAFNEENDGIVYAGAAAIGFAALENVLYVARLGLGAGVLRAFTAIPLHVLTAVLMGLSIGRARFVTPRAARQRLLLRGFALAWLFHGLYDALAMSGSALVLLLLPLLAGLAAFGVIALRTGRRLSLARWAGPLTADASPAEPAPAADAGLPDPPPLIDAVAQAPAAPARPRRIAAPQRWMPVVSRILLGASALFWALLALGLAGAEGGSDAGAGVLGGVVLTIVPVSLGIILEVAWARRRRRGREAAAG
jgi:RsiW-degrading membrane proteinase PrsW (M82 family)